MRAQAGQRMASIEPLKSGLALGSSRNFKREAHCMSLSFLNFRTLGSADSAS